MYATWVKIDDTLPWIELKDVYQTKIEAQAAVKEILSKTEIKIVTLPERKRCAKAAVVVSH
jgi:hypothetical protein